MHTFSFLPPSIHPSLPPSLADIEPVRPVLRRVYPQCVPDISRAYINGSVTLECIPPDGYPMVNVTWYRYGQELQQKGNNSDIVFSNRRRNMTISPIKFDNNGDYHCQVANPFNEDSPLESDVLVLSVEGMAASLPTVCSQCFQCMTFEPA